MFFDLHNDFPTASDITQYAHYLSEQGDDVKITAVIWTSEIAKTGVALAAVTNITNELKSLGSVPIAIEDIGFTGEYDRYRTFDFSKYLYCSLTWNFNNCFAGGALDDGVLTEDGERVIEIINGCGCAIDLAHLNRKSFYAVLDRTDNVLCSHTGFNKHPRSLDDGMIRALTDKRALIGLCAVTSFTDATNACEFANVIDDFVQKYGIEHLAFGTDFNGSTDIPKEIASYKKIEAAVRTLANRGYSEADINKILYKNALCFYDRRFKQ